LHHVEYLQTYKNLDAISFDLAEQCSLRVTRRLTLTKVPKLRSEVAERKNNQFKISFVVKIIYSYTDTIQKTYNIQGPSSSNLAEQFSLNT